MNYKKMIELAKEIGIEEIEIIVKKTESKEKIASTKTRKPSPSDMKKMEAKIEAKELELEQLRELRFEPEYYQDASKMQQLEDQIDDLVNEVTNLMNTWEEMMKLMED